MKNILIIPFLLIAAQANAIVISRPIIIPSRPPVVIPRPVPKPTPAPKPVEPTRIVPIVPMIPILVPNAASKPR